MEHININYEKIETKPNSVNYIQDDYIEFQAKELLPQKKWRSNYNCIMIKIVKEYIPYQMVFNSMNFKGTEKINGFYLYRFKRNITCGGI